MVTCNILLLGPSLLLFCLWHTESGLLIPSNTNYLPSDFKFRILPETIFLILLLFIPLVSTLPSHDFYLLHGLYVVFITQRVRGEFLLSRWINEYVDSMRRTSPSFLHSVNIFFYKIDLCYVPTRFPTWRQHRHNVFQLPSVWIDRHESSQTLREVSHKEKSFRK